MPDQKSECECLTVSVDVAAKLLGISRGLAYAMVREKRIKALFFGRRILIPKAALNRLLNGQNQDSKGGEVNKQPLPLIKGK